GSSLRSQLLCSPAAERRRYAAHGSARRRSASWVVTWERSGGIFRNRPRSRSHLMSDATAKERALRALEQLPEDATLEDAMERLFLLEKIERGRADMREGRSVAHEDVVERFGLR